jgi:CRP-like cAMP-binding protein
MRALRLYDAAVAAAPLDFEARLKVADCLVALGEHHGAATVYRAVAWYALESGHPLTALVAARVLETLAAEYEDILAALVVRYGSESEIIGKFAARINVPAADTPVNPPDLRAPPPVDLVHQAAERAATCTSDFDEYPEAVHPIPLLSELSEDAFRRVLATLIVRRMPHGELVIRQGEPGSSFFFVATGEVRVFTSTSLGAALGEAPGQETELARLHEGTIFGEMALLSAQPRSASVQVVNEADLIEVTRESLRTLAGELTQVATALQAFTRERLLRNLMATNALFKPFDSTQRRDLLRRFTSHDVASGTSIIHEGEQGAGLFVLLSGEVEVSKTAAGGPVLLATLRAGDVFGEMALLGGAPTSATVTATRPATVLFLAREYVDRMVAGVPEIRSYLEALAEDRRLDTQLAGVAPGDSDEDALILI